MKFSIRSKFSTGMVFLIIILALSIYSAYYMNNISKETGAILKENYISVVYARDMAEGLTKINQEITRSFIINGNPNAQILKNELKVVGNSFESEKNNITEPGEDKLVKEIETDLNEYSDSVLKYLELPHKVTNVLFLQKKYDTLFQQLMHLSQMNGKAIEVKTDNTKISSQEAMTQMSIIATLCFIIALFYSYSFSSYSSEQFNHLYNGVIKLGSGNYTHRLDFDGTDKFSEISLVINEMARKLNENENKTTVNKSVESEKSLDESEIQALKNVLARIRNIESEAEILIAKLEEKA
jgi:two-component system, NtrC family, sensor histidine kinase KinB